MLACLLQGLGIPGTLPATSLPIPCSLQDGMLAVFLQRRRIPGTLPVKYLPIPCSLQDGMPAVFVAEIWNSWYIAYKILFRSI